MLRRWGGRAGLLVVLAATLLLAVWVRLGGPEAALTPFTYDAAFHYRMTLATLRGGSPPDTDPLFVQEPLRNPQRMLPPNLYYLAALFIRAGQWIMPGPADRWIHLLDALTGALILLPLYLLGRAFGGNRWPALLFAALGTLFPPLAERTGFHIFRYESLAHWLLLMQVWLLVRPARPPGPGPAAGTGREVFPPVSAEPAPVAPGSATGHEPAGFFLPARWVLPVTASALGHLFGLGLWRLYAPSMTLFFLCVLVYRFWRGSARSGWGWFPAGYAGAGLAANFLYVYYRQGGFLERLPLLLTLLPLLVYLAVHQLIPAAVRWPGWKKAILLAVLAAGSLGSCWHFAPLFRLRLQLLCGLSPAPTFINRLYADGVAELRGFDLPAFFLKPADSCGFSLLFLFIAAVWFSSRRQRSGSGPGLGQLWLMAGLLTLLSVMFLRAAPLLLCFLFALAGAMTGRIMESRPMDRRMLGIAAAGILLAGLVMVPIFLAQARQRIAVAAAVREEPLFAWLRQHTPADAVVAAHWDMGYEIQTYGRRPVLMDGFFESAVAIRRIEQFYRALFSPDERELRAVLGQWGAGCLVLDQRMFVPMARFLGYDVTTLLAPGGDAGRELRPTPAGMRVNYLRFLAAPESGRWFTLEARVGPYVVLKPIQERH